VAATERHFPDRSIPVYEQIARNKRRTFLMLLGFVVIVTLVAAAIVLLFGGGWVGVIIAFVIAMALAWGSYYNSDKIAIAASRAKPADETEYRRYHNLVEGLCIAAGLPKPRLYVVDDPAPNAFATGRNPKHAAVAVTTGLLETMNRVELEGVLAHELSHIKNYDILVTTIAVTAVGTIALISDIGLRFAFWGGMSDRRDNNGGSGPIGAIIAIASLAVLMLAPFAGYLMKMAMSRNREYLADASGVQLTRYPPGLISALEKLRADQAIVHHATKATAQMWIEQPLETEKEKPGSKFNTLFDTHPPLEDRIRRLQEM
jgi:heat shock protein HtpX